MATTEDYIEFVCGQLDGCGNVRSRKMFGDYIVYVNDKPIFTVCDNTVYVKIKKEIEHLMEDAEKGCPYDGAKEQYVLDIENRELTAAVVDILEPITPLPKKRKKQ